MTNLSRRGALSNDDKERIEYALGFQPDHNNGLFPADGPVRHINRELVLMLGGGRALLMQIAHPMVAAGVATFSNFETEPLARLFRTLELTLAMVFGDTRTAMRALRTIERRHERVRGTLAQKAGPFSAGTPYTANDPDLLFWVHATLIDSAMTTYSRFVRPLSPMERASFYKESKITARLFGIEDGRIPHSVKDFDGYMANMIDGAHLSIVDDGRRVASSIVDPPLPPGLRQLAGSSRIFTHGLLPAPLRDRFEIPWNTSRERSLQRLQALARSTLPLLPSRLRYFPQAIAATKRLQ